MSHTPSPARYSNPALYRRCGRSGLKLPLLSLGLWHNFGGVDSYENSRALVLRAFDQGITHFDLANNYGPPPGSAETTFGRIVREDLAAHRDELIVSTKAGYDMWEGPYGDWGSRKYLLASLDQSLKRLGLDYVDIFYSHRPDPGTPVEETMGALAHAVRSGKALYTGLSNYDPAQTERASRLLREMGTPCLIHQPRYNMLDRAPERGLLDTLAARGDRGHRLLPARSGPAHQQVPGRDPRRLPRRARPPVPQARADHGGQAGAAAQPGRRRQGPRPVARPAGAGLGAAPAGDHVRAHRREQDLADRREPRRAQGTSPSARMS